MPNDRPIWTPKEWGVFWAIVAVLFVVAVASTAIGTGFLFHLGWRLAG